MNFISSTFASLLPPRMNRTRYLASSFVSAMILCAIAYMAGYKTDTQDLPDLWLAILLFFFGLWNITIMVKRLHDMDRSGWWWFINFIPIVNIIFCLAICTGPGSIGDNRFGPQPEKSSALVYFLGLAPVVIILGILAIAGIAIAFKA